MIVCRIVWSAAKETCGHTCDECLSAILETASFLSIQQRVESTPGEQRQLRGRPALRDDWPGRNSPYGCHQPSRLRWRQVGACQICCSQVLRGLKSSMAPMSRISQHRAHKVLGDLTSCHVWQRHSPEKSEKSTRLSLNGFVCDVRLRRGNGSVDRSHGSGGSKPTDCDQSSDSFTSGRTTGLRSPVSTQASTTTTRADSNSPLESTRAWIALQADTCTRAE